MCLMAGIMAYTYNPSTEEEEMGLRSFLLYREFKASLGYGKPYFKRTTFSPQKSI